MGNALDAVTGAAEIKATLTEHDVRMIRTLREDYLFTVPRLHEKYPQVTISTLYKVIEYVSWPLVTKLTQTHDNEQAIKRMVRREDYA
jgi:hypothetical protein